MQGRQSQAGNIQLAQDVEGCCPQAENAFSKAAQVALKAKDENRHDNGRRTAGSVGHDVGKDGPAKIRCLVKVGPRGPILANSLGSFGVGDLHCPIAIEDKDFAVLDGKLAAGLLQGFLRAGPSSA